VDFLDLVVLSLNLRLGEALALRWEEDLDVSALSVTLAWQRVGGELRSVEPKTEQRRRE